MAAITRTALDSGAISNTVSSDALHAFFDAKEQFFHYRQFSNASRRRDFAPSFIEAIEHFLLASSGSLEAIYELYVRPRRKLTRDSSALTTLKGEWDRFTEFFDAAALTNLTAAKSAYRRAARTLHPDVGGNAADMVALNAVFAELLDIMVLKEAEAGLQTDPSIDRPGGRGGLHSSSFAGGDISPGFWPGSVLQYPRSAHEFDILLRTEALLAAIDIFDEDRHAHLGLGLSFNPTWAVTRSSEQEAFEKGDACERVAAIIRFAMEATTDSKLSFGLAGLRELGQVWIGAAIRAWIEHGRIEARATSSQPRVAELEERAKVAGHFPFVERWREVQLRQLLDRIEHPGTRAKDRFALNHILQAENAFRRKLITSTRHTKTIDRLKDKQDALAGVAAAIADHASSIGFMKLEHDPLEADNEVTIRFVAETNPNSAFGNWHLGSVQSCRAYGEAYYRSEKLEGKLKFVRQRLWILLSSLVTNPDRWDAERILAGAQEVGLLEKAARVGREGQASEHAAELHDFLLKLAEEGAPKRERRLRLLRDLAREDFRDHLPEGAEPMLQIARTSGPHSYGSKLMTVVPSPDYYRAALRSLDELEDFLGGKAWFDPRQDSEQEGRRYLSEHMRKLDDRMVKAVDVEPAEKKVAKLGPLVRQAIDKGMPLSAAAEWQLGYFMDKLTGAMVRARQLAKAALALEEYFALPDAYRRFSTPSEEKRLRARLVRCRRDADLT